METRELNYEDRCMIRIEKNSKIMGYAEKAKQAKKDWDGLDWKKRVLAFIVSCMIIYLIIVYYRKIDKKDSYDNKIKFIYAWLGFSVFAISVYFIF